MKLWMSAEIMVDVHERYRTIRNEIEPYINENIGSGLYGEPVEKWAYVAIMRPAGDSNYPEFYKYHKSRKVAEFRLKIDYELFKEAQELDQKRLICQSLLRSIKLFSEIGIKNFNHIKLEEDFINLAKAKNWL